MTDTTSKTSERVSRDKNPNQWCVLWCKWNDQEIMVPICKCQGEGMLSAPKEKTEKRIFTQKGKGKRQGGVSKRGGEF